jgi:hypothetical protein
MNKLIIDLSNNGIDTLIYNEINVAHSLEELEIFADIIKNNISVKTLIYEINGDCICAISYIPQNVNCIIFNVVSLSSIYAGKDDKCNNVKILQLNFTDNLHYAITSLSAVMPNVEIIKVDTLNDTHPNYWNYLYKIPDSFKNLKKLIIPMNNKVKEIFEKTYPTLQIESPFISHQDER